ncbi:MAG TPA: peptide ABC transporter substrate-binding protein [Pseudonocardia sp.]|jgi:peptide/nickel transport system substrate-binding protein|uniref:peptide ABC transporter substrate-binding protein n=1 Tax=Pseudonocardia sp. TaxID=60912 RepID=UPI002ED7BD04
MKAGKMGRGGLSRALLVLMLCACLGIAGCAGAQRQHGGGQGRAVTGGSVSFALPPGATPNWLLPISLPGFTASFNRAIRAELYVPLYLYSAASGTVGPDDAASAADPPSYAPDGRSVTITLKHLTWSDGNPLTSRDVEFWVNLARANKQSWAMYSSGLIPDNIVSFQALDEHSFTLHLDRAYNPDWFTANQLTRITPMPQRAWGRTGPDAPVSDADRTDAGAKQVFGHLVEQAKNLADYSTNPLWKVVNGPFTLASFSPSGHVVITRNPRYTGPDPAHLDTVTFLPFTSGSAEYNVLLAGGLDFGYLPTANLGQRPKLEALGYRIEPWAGWAITYAPYNFANPTLGAVFGQLYLRQAIQYAVNQPAIAEVIWRGTATPGYGPVPQDNDDRYLSEPQRANPYPFDPGRAGGLLAEHGWRPGGDGVLACAMPGTGPADCGAGIAAGTRLDLTILAESGSGETDGTMQVLKSELSKVGVGLSIKSQPLNSVLANSSSCTRGGGDCSWQLSYFGTQGSWYFEANPSGENLFATGASVNFGNYSSARADELITATTTGRSPDAMRDYSALLAERLPVVWLPNPPYQVSAIDAALRGVVQDPLGGLQPQRWYRTR